jgi:transposase
VTPEEALAIYTAGPEVVVKHLCEVHAQLEAAQERVKALEEQLRKNSRNSSKPPSSDGFKKPAPPSSEQHEKKRKGKKRKPGGQKGHKGSGLTPVEKPDHTIVHEAHKCKKCGRSLKKQTPTGYEARQVFDIPPLNIEVTEHQAEIKECPHCGEENKAPFPEDVKGPVQYGPRVKAIAVYLKNYQLLPYKRTRELFKDIFSADIVEGTLVNINKDCSRRLEPTMEEIQEVLKASPVGNFDETGCSVEGKRIWLHVACTPEFTYYEIHDKRGREAMDDIGILPDFKGRAIHDFWQSYLSYDCSHGLCNAHLLRELIFLYEEQDQCWAEKMIDCLLDIKEAVDKAKKRGSSALRNGKVKEFEELYDAAVEAGFAENPMPVDAPTGRKGARKRGRPKKTKAQNLLFRFRDHKDEILAFMHDFRVPFDNNLAERDIRMMKVQQKISGTFRSRDGGKDFCRIRSYISTIRKHAMNVIDAIRKVFLGTPFVPSSDTS